MVLKITILVLYIITPVRSEMALQIIYLALFRLSLEAHLTGEKAETRSYSAITPQPTGMSISVKIREIPRNDDNYTWSHNCILLKTTPHYTMYLNYE